MRDRIGADMDSFFQMTSPFRYPELPVLVGIERCESHGVVASQAVSRAPHHIVNVLKNLVGFFLVKYLQTCKPKNSASRSPVLLLWHAVSEHGSHPPITRPVALHGEGRTRDGDPSSPLKPPRHARPLWQVRGTKHVVVLQGYRIIALMPG